MKWSVYFQTPEYLEQTRMFLILPEMEPLVRRWCGIRDGMRILDVGCGTGYFTRLLVKGGEKVTAVGLDLEEPFIAYAKELAAAENLPVEFVAGDALALPFEDASFDLVASHTFLTSVPDPVRAMAEMKRVVRPGGMIASVTPMEFMPCVNVPGSYPEECTWHRPLTELRNKVYTAYYTLDPVKQRVAGIKPGSAPGFFAEQGLRQICAYPIGKMTSWSNAAVPEEKKLRWLELYHEGEVKRLKAFLALPGFDTYITKVEAESYLDLMEQECAWLRSHTDENRIWEWSGDANLLLTGVWQPAERRE